MGLHGQMLQPAAANGRCVCGTMGSPLPLVANSTRGELTRRAGTCRTAEPPATRCRGLEGLRALPPLPAAWYQVPRRPRQHCWHQLHTGHSGEQDDHRIMHRIPSHPASRHTPHPITPCIPSHPASHHSMDGVQKVSAPLPNPSGHVPRLGMRRLARCSAPLAACARRALAKGHLCPAAVADAKHQVVVRGFGRFMTVLEGNDSDAHTPSQQDAN